MKLATRLQEMGYVGNFDLDAVIDARGSAYLLEINARRTGGTYVHEFGRHTFGDDYLERLVLVGQNAVSSGGITDLDGLFARLEGLLYPDYGPGGGVVITVTSTLPSGEFGCILVAPDETAALALNEALEKRLLPQQLAEAKP